PHAGDRLADAALVDAEPAVDPIDLAAAVLGGAEEPLDPQARQRVVLGLRVAAVDRIGVRRLLGERERDRALVGEDGGGAAAARREAGEPQRGARPLVLERRVHEDKCQFLGHLRTSQCQIALLPSTIASSTASSDPTFTPGASRVSAMPRTRSE